MTLANEYQLSKIAGASIFRLAITHINRYGWDHNSMDILLTVSAHSVWPQPMAVMMFSELEYALGSETLTDFDNRVQDKSEVVSLFEKVAFALEND